MVALAHGRAQAHSQQPPDDGLPIGILIIKFVPRQESSRAIRVPTVGMFAPRRSPGHLLLSCA